MRALIGTLCLCVMAGCTGDSGPAAPKLYPVNGSLKVNGQPLANIVVQLTPTSSSSNIKPAVGTTDAEGKFKIATNGDRGAAAGSYKVSLAGGEPAAAAVEMPSSGGEAASKAQAEMATKMQAQFMKTRGPVAAKKLFPKEWSDPTTSPKTYEVKADANNTPLDIDI